MTTSLSLSLRSRLCCLLATSAIKPSRVTSSPPGVVIISIEKVVANSLVMVFKRAHIALTQLYISMLWIDTVQSSLMITTDCPWRPLNELPPSAPPRNRLPISWSVTGVKGAASDRRPSRAVSSKRGWSCTLRCKSKHSKRPFGSWAVASDFAGFENQLHGIWSCTSPDNTNHWQQSTLTVIPSIGQQQGRD